MLVNVEKVCNNTDLLLITRFLQSRPYCTEAGYDAFMDQRWSKACGYLTSGEKEREDVTDLYVCQNLFVQT